MQECYYFSVCSDWVLFIELQLLRNEKGINESELFRVVIISSIGTIVFCCFKPEFNS